MKPRALLLAALLAFAALAGCGAKGDPLVPNMTEGT